MHIIIIQRQQCQSISSVPLHRDKSEAFCSEAMMQSFMSSGIHLKRQEGFLSSVQRQTRHQEICNRDGQNNCIRFPCKNFFDSTKSVFSTCDNPITHRNQFLQTFTATSNGDEFVLQAKDDQKATLLSKIWKSWISIYRFSRPYTLIGIITQVSSISLLPLTSVGDLSLQLFVGYLKAMIPFLFAKIYVAGINQLYDVEVDKINKPYLPLASEELSMGQGNAIVSTCGFMCLATGIMSQSLPLFIGVLVYFLFGTIYSAPLPFLRWKTKPFLAPLCLVGGYALAIQPAVFNHIQHVLGKPLAFTKSLGFIMLFYSLLFYVIALVKDLPDGEGDRVVGNITFTVRHGKKKVGNSDFSLYFRIDQGHLLSILLPTYMPLEVFSFCVIIMLIAYLSAAVIGASSSFLICKLVSVIGHGTLASILLLRAKSVNLDDDVEIQSFYMLLWKWPREASLPK